MKETVNVNIASQAFTLDDDAYAVLRRYLDDIRRRLPQEDNNTMEDVEARIADIFRERLSSPMMVVSLASVRAIAGICGGLADYLRVDPLVIRLLTLFLILFGGLSIWIYIILWLVVPEEPQSINTRK